MENVILQPIEVGGQTFKNRIMFPPLTTGYEKNGMISESRTWAYTCLAKGGVGYIVLGDVAPINSFSPTLSCLTTARSRLRWHWADSVHAYGTKLGVQLFPPGVRRRRLITVCLCRKLLMRFAARITT